MSLDYVDYGGIIKEKVLHSLRFKLSYHLESFEAAHIYFLIKVIKSVRLFSTFMALISQQNE